MSYSELKVGMQLFLRDCKACGLEKKYMKQD